MEKKKAQETLAAMEENKMTAGAVGEKETADKEISETWAEDTIAELDDFIESQGIYIRQ